MKTTQKSENKVHKNQKVCFESVFSKSNFNYNLVVEGAVMNRLHIIVYQYI